MVARRVKRRIPWTNAPHLRKLPPATHVRGMDPLMHPPPPGHFDTTWRERVRLRNGRRATLRLLVPEDRELYLQAFAQLSPQARYQRFFGTKDQLTPAEIHYFVDVDQVHHFSIVAVVGRKHPHGVGLARCVEIPGHANVAEPAVTVLDAWQGQGLGRMLLRRLIEAARERGVQRFHVDVLADNAPMLNLMDEIGTQLMPPRDNGIVTMDLPLPPPRPDRPPRRERSALERMLRLAAKGMIRVMDRMTE